MKTELFPFLTGKDKKKLWPHITVQNKVTAWKALQTATELRKDFKPFTIQATGFSLWHFNKGPWIPAGEFLFEAI